MAFAPNREYPTWGFAKLCRHGRINAVREAIRNGEDVNCTENAKRILQ